MNKRLFMLLCVACPAIAQDAIHILTEAQNRGRAKSQRYEGSLQVFNAKQQAAAKRWIYQRLGSDTNSKAILRFTAPPEMQGVALLVVNHPDRTSEQWIWIPAEGRDRRIALQDRSTRFFGTDFSFEDLEERDVDQFDYKMMPDEASWKIEARPKASKSSQYTSSILWVRKDNYVITRIDNFNNGKLIRRITYTGIQKIDNIWTPLTVEAFDATKNSRTVLKLDRVAYNIPLNDESFTRDALH